jgi:hypothetical protein
VIQSQWVGRDFPHPSETVLGITQPSEQWVADLFPGVKRPVRGVDHPPTTSAQIKRKCRAIPLLPLWLFMAYSREKFTFFTFPVPNQEYQNHTPICLQQFIEISNNSVDTFILLLNKHFFLYKSHYLKTAYQVHNYRQPENISAECWSHG